MKQTNNELRRILICRPEWADVYASNKGHDFFGAVDVFGLNFRGAIRPSLADIDCIHSLSDMREILELRAMLDGVECLLSKIHKSGIKLGDIEKELSEAIAVLRVRKIERN